MKTGFYILSAALLLSAGAVKGADLREIGQAELRKCVNSRGCIAYSQIVDSLQQSVDGQPVDVRAFFSDNIYYRVLIKQANGKFGSIIINAETGEYLRRNSAIAEQIRVVARSGQSISASSGNSGNGSGNGNSGGNGGNGNSGGNDNGRGNGNGNGGGKPNK